MILENDATFGDIVADLKRQELYEESWIIVVSDHGEQFWGNRPDLAKHEVALVPPVYRNTDKIRIGADEISGPACFHPEVNEIERLDVGSRDRGDAFEPMGREEAYPRQLLFVGVEAQNMLVHGRLLLDGQKRRSKTGGIVANLRIHHKGANL